MRVQSNTTNLILRVRTPSPTDNSISNVAKPVEQEVDYSGISKLFNTDKITQKNIYSLPLEKKIPGGRSTVSPLLNIPEIDFLLRSQPSQYNTYCGFEPGFLLTPNQKLKSKQA